MVDLIQHKRDGARLSREALAFIVRGATDGSIPDYQLAAWLMAVCLRGMVDDEAAELTFAMAASGVMNDLRTLDGRVVVDKHSTGGVGDKATLVVAPIVAACGVPVAKLTGRGLGHSGGTLDKLEAISGLRTSLSAEEFRRLLAEHDLAIAGQSAELAPADGVLYALRDATATVESVPLIAASIMSKKLAGGAGAVLLDVKVGSGAFMKDRASAERLARLMVTIGEAAGRGMRAVLSNMEQPLGRAVGNALEVAEAVACLRGEGPDDLDLLCRREAAELLLLAGRTATDDEASRLVDTAVGDGGALRKLAEVVAVQGGDASQILEPERLPRAPVVLPFPSPRDGYLSKLDALTIGQAAVRLGAGRATKADTIHHEVGFVLHAKVGDRVHVGEPLLEVHATDQESARRALAEVASALAFADEPVVALPVLLGEAVSGPHPLPLCRYA